MDDPTGMSQQGSWQYVAPNGEVRKLLYNM